ncbi:recombinase family protein [Nocardia alba]|uniref:recombinase family protein n=1 Tax=Nocardia alba TaxID=225051 RepID=UPI000AAFB9CA|nr:recombinase family protein [Nocardia alba]
MVFTVLAALSGMEREYIRDRTLQGHESARARGKSIGGASVSDDTMLAMALHLRGNNHSLRDIASRLVITTGKKKGRPRPPSCDCCASTTRPPPGLTAPTPNSPRSWASCPPTHIPARRR